MLSLLFSGILVASTLAGKPCCMDRQFEARMGEVGGGIFTQKGKPNPALINGDNVIHYDFYARKTMVEATMNYANGSSVTSNVVIDAITNQMHVMTKDGCFTTKSYVPMLEGCVPDDAVKVRESYIGYGVTAIPFTTWQFLIPKSGIVMRLSVTDQGCVPIFESLFGDIGGGSADIIYILTNFRPGISKPNAFQVPNDCVPLPSNDAPDVVRRSIDKAESLMKHFQMNHAL
ncbi:uncharacterized protein LOC124133835 [Haliotis rufescens]|uniref:uncharacterized protein LOC124133835 n=1 Tax=Haliotis rufescens TaxID=6454 RepID=UPI00201F2783|nr:uncharacterized protein LOC124133835 [Haliotis rufescens]